MLKAWDPQTLEGAMQMAEDEDIEYNSKLKIEKLQDNFSWVFKRLRGYIFQ